MADKVYDIVIAGGGTSGCACAYTAGKLGMKVLLVEPNTYLGGSITSALVIPAMKTSDNAINTDFFNTLYNELHKINGASTYSDGNKGWFNPELTKIVLDKLLKSVDVEILFESFIEKIDNKLSSYIVTVCDNNSTNANKELLLPIEAKYIVDGTGDAKICKKLNYNFLDENNYQTQPINLRFIMSGINIDEFSRWLTDFDKNENVTTCCHTDNTTLLSTACTWDTNNEWALRPLFEDAIKEGILTEEDSNYFQLFSVAGTQDSVAFNCPRLLDNKISRTDAYIKGRESILRLSEFCKKYFPGFENAHISSIANSLGVRVSRRVKGKYVYTKDDLISGKRLDKPVVISNYPIDIHSSDKNSSKLEIVNQEYQLPIESLIVDDRLFVIGRCISADFEAQAALRIIPSCFSMGEGLAKYIYKIENN